MTYTFKLSRRLAASRSGITLTLLLGLAACGEHTATAPSEGADAVGTALDAAATTYRRLALQPRTFILAPGQVKWFKTYGVTRDGNKVPVTPTYRVAGGTMTAAGKFTAGLKLGTFRIVATYGGLADTSVVTIAKTSGGETPPPPPPPPTGGRGVPFGPFGMWDGNTPMPHTEVFNASIQANSPGSILTRISIARERKLRLMLVLTGGGRAQYLTDGVFDYAKWKAKIDEYATPAIRQAIADGVADGTIVGNMVIGEPHNDGGPGNESNSWGPEGTLTKASVDRLCAYQKTLFPGLPAGVNADHNAFESDKGYQICDFSISQYRAGKGDVRAYRDAALAMGRRDGHKIAFSINVLDGGTRDNDRDGRWECPVPQTGGQGTYAPNCRMTPAQIEEFGKVLSGGCALFMWVYDEEFMGKSANQEAFRRVREAVDQVTPPSCARS